MNTAHQEHHAYEVRKFNEYLAKLRMVAAEARIDLQRSAAMIDPRAHRDQVQWWEGYEQALADIEAGKPSE